MWWMTLACSETTVPVGTTPPSEPVGATLTTGSTLTAGPQIACADPSLRGEAVFDTFIVGEDWEGLPVGFVKGEKGVVVSDFDGDGWFDLLIPRASYPTRLYLGAGAEFSQSSGPAEFIDATARLGPDLLDASGGSAADVDGDGDQDAVLFRFASEPVLLVNDGTGTFSQQLLVVETDSQGCGGSATWGDYDLDGDLDLFLGRQDFEEGGRICDSWLFDNVGGSLVHVPDVFPDDIVKSAVTGGAFLPMDDDIEPELYIAANNLAARSNRVMDNDGGTLSLVASHSLDVGLQSMGIGIGDLNHDGVVDVVVPGVDAHAVMVSTAGVWVNKAQAWGITTGPDQKVGWGGEIFDLDNDGLDEIVFTYGTHGGTVGQPDEIHRQTALGVWETVGAAWGYDDPDEHGGLILADLDRNGFVDSVRRRTGGWVVIDLARCNDERWVRVKLHQEGPNPDALGAVVRAEGGGDQWWRLMQQGNNSYVSGGPPEVHIGVGPLDAVDLVVTWPDGEVERFPEVPTRRFVTIARAGAGGSTDQRHR